MVWCAGPPMCLPSLISLFILSRFFAAAPFFSTLILISHIAFTGWWGFSLHWFRFLTLLSPGGARFPILIFWFNSDCCHRAVRFFLHWSRFLTVLSPGGEVFLCVTLLSPSGEVFLYVDSNFSQCFHRAASFFSELIPISHSAFAGRWGFSLLWFRFLSFFTGRRGFSLHRFRFLTLYSPGGEVFLFIDSDFFSHIAFTGWRRAVKFFSTLTPISHIVFTGWWSFHLHWYSDLTHGFHQAVRCFSTLIPISPGGEVFLYIDSDFSHCFHRVAKLFSTLILISQIAFTRWGGISLHWFRFLTLLWPGGFSLHWFWFLGLLSPGGEVFLYIDSDFPHCFHRVIFLYIDSDFSDWFHPAVRFSHMHCCQRVVRFFFTLIPISHIAFTGRCTFPYIGSDFSHCFHGVVKFSSTLIFCFNPDYFHRVVRFFFIHWSWFLTVLSPGGEVFLCITLRFFSTLIPISDIAFTGRRRFFFSELIPISHIAFTGWWGFSLHWFRFLSLFTRGGEVFLYIDSDFSHCIHRAVRFFSLLIPISFLTLLSPGGAGWWGFSLHWFWFLKLLSPGGEVFLYIDSDFSHCFHRVVKLFSTLILISQIAFTMQVVKFSSIHILILLRLLSSGGEVFLYTDSDFSQCFYLVAKFFSTLTPISHIAFTGWFFFTLILISRIAFTWWWGFLTCIAVKGRWGFCLHWCRFLDIPFNGWWGCALHWFWFLTLLSPGGGVLLYIDSDFSHCFHRAVSFFFFFTLISMVRNEIVMKSSSCLAASETLPSHLGDAFCMEKYLTFRAPAILQIWRNAALSTTSIRLQVHQILRLFSSTLFWPYTLYYSLLFTVLYSSVFFFAFSALYYSLLF